jgi:oligoribonuclease NrnB/cAMP/cGMP phosphodiesterase (DHH superfamily)
VIALNGGGFSSNAFKSVYDPYKHDIMMPFRFNGTLWTFSIYTTKDDIDCSALAKEMGGGGHRKAAGFEMKSVNEPDFPFWL